MRSNREIIDSLNNACGLILPSEINLPQFEQGQKLIAIGYDNCEVWYEVGKNDVTDITVVMENGQMAGVPWALVTFKSGGIEQRKINLALCNEVLVRRD